jgi:hypothetical protein
MEDSSLSAWDEALDLIDTTLSDLGVPSPDVKKSAVWSPAEAVSQRLPELVEEDDSHAMACKLGLMESPQLKILQARKSQAELKAKGLRQLVLKNEEELARLSDLEQPSSPSFSSSRGIVHSNSKGKAYAASSCIADFRIATARSDDAEVFLKAFWAQQPEAIRMLDDAIEAWTGARGMAGASIAKACARECATASNPSAIEEVVPGGPCDDRDTFWARMLLGQEAKIEWLLADNDVRRKRLALQEKMPELSTCPVGQRELRLLHGEAMAQQELIGHLLTVPPPDTPGNPQPDELGEAPSNTSRTPSPMRRSAWSPRRCEAIASANSPSHPSLPSRRVSPSRSSPAHAGASDVEDSQPRSDRLAGLRSAFLRSGLTVRTPEALAELMRDDVADVIGALLEDAWRLRRQCCARHGAAVEAAQRARLTSAGMRCDALVQENARLLATLDTAGQRRQAALADQYRCVASLAMRRSSMQGGASPLSPSSLATDDKPRLQSPHIEASPEWFGTPWSPAGRAIPSHHTPSGAFTDAMSPEIDVGKGAHPLASPGGSAKSLSPWWAARAARRTATAEKSTSGSKQLRISRLPKDQCFDEYSVHNPCLAAPSLRRIAMANR